MLVSVIVPVYNVIGYVRACLESVASQEYRDIEVICVDDGSDDGSGGVCAEFAQLDGRFSLITTPNRGVGPARNLALQHARGEYCFFLDPDDLLPPDAIGYLVDLISRTDSDIALGESSNFRDVPLPSKDEVSEQTFDHHDDIVDKVAFGKSDLWPAAERQHGPTVRYEFFSCLYKMGLVIEHGVHFLPISYGEDTYFLFHYLLISHRAATSTKPVYFHRRNPTSTTFSYHPNYLAETKQYYAAYLNLFEVWAPAYVERARWGLDAQYFFRCSSAVERELLFAPSARSMHQMRSALTQLRRDGKFSSLNKEKNIRLVGQRYLRVALWALRIGAVTPLVAVAKSRFSLKARAS